MAVAGSVTSTEAIKESKRLAKHCGYGFIGNLKILLFSSKLIVSQKMF